MFLKSFEDNLLDGVIFDSIIRSGEQMMDDEVEGLISR